jgi:membrane protein DedA with SNARE-associated domain
MLLASISEVIVNETAHFIAEAGLPGVFLLMAISSMCIPIPGEVVMLFGGFVVADPAAAHAADEMTLVGLVLAGLAGTLVGSWVAYAIGRGGRLELFERHGDKFHMGPAQLEKADRWFQRRGDLAVMVGRVIPVVRAFISLPAGLSKMNFWRFSLFTLIGSIPFVLGLALAGEALGSEWHEARKVFEYLDYVIVIAIVVGIVVLLMRRRRSGRGDTADAQP